MTAGEQDRNFARSPNGGAPKARGEVGAADPIARRGEMMLLVSLLLEDPDLVGAEALRRVARQLRLCADIPELAAPIVDCDPQRLDAVLLRMTANLLAATPRSDH
jgi:hypothetical protein